MSTQSLSAAERVLTTVVDQVRRAVVEELRHTAGQMNDRYDAEFCLDRADAIEASAVAEEVTR